MIFYSPQTGGFYADNLHAHIPTDAVAITSEEHAALLEAQTRGLVIRPGAEGRPVAVTAPGPSLAEAKGTKRAAIAVGHDAALAGVVAISDPTPTVVAVEAALLATTDPTGLDYARQKLATRRAELEAQVDAAQTVEAVTAVVVSYPV
ncbi:phage tail protein [Nitratidesulfovibrio vulgaris]|uniref:phage tail protein n=1 Tax=Nitratidesulfovibrio vulgaris TaxID=881 RepID=UPI0013E02AAE|nr:phage tail protein [Nitratidesulfovibrio vulgaris]